MTAHLPRLPIKLDPLIKEANRRMRRRRLLLSLVVVALAAAGLTLTLQPRGAGTPFGAGVGTHGAGSGRFSGREQSAISAAQRYNGYLRIFPRSPQTISCRIPVGGPFDPNAHPVNGRCATAISGAANGTRLAFTEQTDMGAGGGETSGGWTVVVDSHDRIISEHPYGFVPQDMS